MTWNLRRDRHWCALAAAAHAGDVRMLAVVAARIDHRDRWCARPEVFDQVTARLIGTGEPIRARGDGAVGRAGAMFRGLDARQREALCRATARALIGAPDDLRHEHVALCARADPAYGTGVVAAVVALHAVAALLA
ncbi:catalase-related domain-containing protein [Paractinoplanes hotanensis]|uniref:Catalase immune-responsive domain-containing protein n=1 Tax=Paractinoplanes hotanensis TaxID=2906497 RepID=A0ABT0Y9W3_9ACTN|nr:catalase-related domain-containing protein [Actinoplanes hotanensis]MCM4082293.1 hypothetical protein [Actinoplanes hotanensis]